MNLRFLFVSLIILSVSASLANDSAERIKARLQNELQQNYLPKLEEKWGKCDPLLSSCLKLVVTNDQRENFMKAYLPSGNVCFPYTLCGFYHCMENKYNCSAVGVNYFTELAFPTCNAYEENIAKNKFSNKAIEWIYTVMVCLQKGLVTECEIEEKCPMDNSQHLQKKTCDHITEFTLQYHPGCYIKSGVGVCHLPLADKLAIWKTVNPFMTARERKEAYKVIFDCFNPLLTSERR